MKLLQTVICPKCQKEMKEDENLKSKVCQTGKKPSAKKYEDCIRKCNQCEIGASNGENFSYIYKDYKKNIPLEFQNNLESTLNNCLNIRNRKNKKIKIGFSSSEDAVSWIFINYFIQQNKLNLLQEVLNLDTKIHEIFLWGVPQLGKLKNDNLKKICRDLKEAENSFSEPDIIIVCDKEITFIEVKVKSENEIKDPLKKDFDKYLNNDFYKNKNIAKKSRLYELIRNWTISHYFSNGKTVKLINLAPQNKFRNDTKLFKKSLNHPDNFIKLAWEDVIGKLNNIKNSKDTCNMTLKEKLIDELKARIPLDQKLFNQK